MNSGKIFSAGVLDAKNCHDTALVLCKEGAITHNPPLPD
jgi:hypothetical protein